MVGTSYCAKVREEYEVFVKKFGETDSTYCIRCPNGCC